jgi:cytoskeleton protein RodZ
MTEETPSVGDELKSAREAQGISIEQAAERLRLMNRQIAAMESDNFTALGQPVFARGFVRNYARMLGLDAEALVARLDKSGIPLSIKAENLPLEEPGSLLTSPWFLGGVAVLVILIAVPVGLYIWLNSGEELRPAGQAAEPPQSAMPVATQPPPLPMVAPMQPGNAVNPGAAEPVPPKDAITLKPIPPAQPEQSQNPPVMQSIIKLDFDEDARVDISEANSGKVLMQREGKAGSSVTLTGTPPFSFEIDNAAHVTMTYNGRPLDLTPYIDDDKVARFNLEQ